MNYNCVFCLLHSFEKLLKKYPISDDLKEKLVFRFISFLSNIDPNSETPEVTRNAFHIITQAIKNPDPFKEEKRQCNDLVLNQYKVLKNKVFKSASPFDTALRYTLAGNIMDIASVPEFFTNSSKSFEESLNNIWVKNLSIDDSKKLRTRLINSKMLLFLGDNCGEAVLDKLFLETIQHPNVYYAVRGGPILNDVTLEDAKYIGLDSVAHIISNGYDAPSTILKHVSDEFINVFSHADVIISKGQGNFEGMLFKNTSKCIFFLMTVKCNVIANYLGVNIGDIVVLNNHESIFRELEEKIL